MNLTHRSLGMAHSPFPTLPTHFTPPVTSSMAAALHQRSPFAIQELLGLDNNRDSAYPPLPRTPVSATSPTSAAASCLGEAFSAWRPNFMAAAAHAAFGASAGGHHAAGTGGQGMLSLGHMAAAAAAAHGAQSPHDHDTGTGRLCSRSF